jgi:hypothetical protein
VLLEEIWQGKESYECDGRLQDFSMLNFISKTPIKKLPGKVIRPTELLSNNFKVHIDGEKYWYQLRF